MTLLSKQAAAALAPLERHLGVSREASFDGSLGLHIDGVFEDRLTGHLLVTDRIRQPFGVLHGGAFAGAAESLATIGTLVSVVGEGRVAMGLSNHTSFLRPVAAGTVTAVAERQHRGRTTWLWDVRFEDEESRRCAVSRVTVAVRGMATG